MVLAFSGHRPQRLPWGSDESDPRCAALRRRIAAAVAEAAAAGYDTFCCGMARGCDFYFAEAVLAQMERDPRLSLEGWVPCISQPDGWPEADRARYDRLLRSCTRVFLLQKDYSPGAMLRRNEAMLDRSDALLTVWDGGSGGTGAAVRYARSKAIPVRGLWR